MRATLIPNTLINKSDADLFDINRKAVLICLLAVLTIGSEANATAIPTMISGIHANNENSCIAAIPLIVGDDCSYNASNPTGGMIINWVGPVAGAGYYASSIGLTTPTAGDGKINPTVSGNITVDDLGNGNSADDTLAGSIVIGAVGARSFSGGPGARGEETWTALTMTFSATTVSSASANGSGFDYIIASAGFPNIITDGAGSFFPSEAASASPGFWLAPGTSGIATAEGQVGAAPSLSVTGHSCVDNLGGGPSGPCGTNSIPGLVTGGATLNLLLAVSTGAAGNIVSGTGIWALEHQVMNTSLSPNSWHASSFSFTSAVPVPPAAWLFGSALGILGWLRRRTT